GVVVAGDDVIDLVGIAVGIDNGDDGDVQLAGLGHSNALLVGVNDEHGLGQTLHVLDAAQILLQLGHLQLQLDNFLLRQQVQGAVLLNALPLVHAADALADGAEVGPHAAQPACVGVVHAAAVGLVTDGLLRLLLGADEQDAAAVGDGLADKVVGLVQL